jgi:hypothetical protein
MGRCRGSCCSPQVLRIISDETQLSLQDIRKSSSGSEKLFGNPKTLLQKKMSSSSRYMDRDRSDSETVALMHKRADALKAAKQNESNANTDS